MNKLQLIKIALLTALLVEEVRNAKGETKYNYDSINGKWKEKKKVENFLNQISSFYWLSNNQSKKK